MSQGRVRRPKCGAQQHKTGLVSLGTTEMLGTGRKGKNRNVTPKTAFGGHIHLKEAEYFRCGGNLELFLKCPTEQNFKKGGEAEKNLIRLTVDETLNLKSKGRIILKLSMQNKDLVAEVVQ